MEALSRDQSLSHLYFIVMVRSDARLREVTIEISRLLEPVQQNCSIVGFDNNYGDYCQQSKR